VIAIAPRLDLSAFNLLLVSFSEFIDVSSIIHPSRSVIHSSQVLFKDKHTRIVLNLILYSKLCDQPPIDHINVSGIHDDKVETFLSRIRIFESPLPKLKHEFRREVSTNTVYNCHIGPNGPVFLRVIVPFPVKPIFV